MVRGEDRTTDITFGATARIIVVAQIKVVLVDERSECVPGELEGKRPLVPIVWSRTSRLEARERVGCSPLLLGTCCQSSKLLAYESKEKTS